MLLLQHCHIKNLYIKFSQKRKQNQDRIDIFNLSPTVECFNESSLILRFYLSFSFYSFIVIFAYSDWVQKCKQRLVTQLNRNPIHCSILLSQYTTSHTICILPSLSSQPSGPSSLSFNKLLLLVPFLFSKMHKFVSLYENNHNSLTNTLGIASCNIITSHELSPEFASTYRLTSKVQSCTQVSCFNISPLPF